MSYYNAALQHSGYFMSESWSINITGSVGCVAYCLIQYI